MFVCVAQDTTAQLHKCRSEYIVKPFSWFVGIYDGTLMAMHPVRSNIRRKKPCMNTQQETATQYH